MSTLKIDPITVNRAAKAGGISKDQAARALAAAGEPPTGGPAYVRRMDYLREACAALGESVWRMSDSTLEKRLRRLGPRCARLIDMAKEADGALGRQEPTAGQALIPPENPS